MDITNCIALVTALIAIFALLWQIWTSNKQSKMQTYLVYTQRYHDIAVNFPIGVESATFHLPQDEKEKENILRWLRAYFDLCSEQYYLNEKKLIDNKVWILWKGGMQDSLQKPAFQQAWKEIQTNNYYNKVFANYIEGLMGIK